MLSAGQGRGSDFARAVNGAAGTLDWSDCNGMVTEAIKRRWADPARLGLGGWSNGGFLSAWGLTATKNRYKAAVVGAGISDWGMLAAESDVLDYAVRCLDPRWPDS